MTILNRIANITKGFEGLKEVYINDKFIHPVQLKFEEFIISKKENIDNFRKIRFGKTDDLSESELVKENTDADIELLLGYTDYKDSAIAFKNAPNFYLFFPLNEEKHRFRFILHSNTFYKSSSRTYLQRGSAEAEGINERTFRVFCRIIKSAFM